MFEVAMPVGTLGLIVDPVMKFLFLESYTVSNEHYLVKRAAFDQVHPLGECFQFSIHLEHPRISNEETPISKIILRNISEIIFSRIELVVEADGEAVIYQDVISLVNIRKTPLIVQLTRIPLNEVEIDVGKIRAKSLYSKIHISLSGISKDGELKSETTTINTGDTSYLYSKFEFKWGVHWNLDYIEKQKEALKQQLHSCLVPAISISSGQNFFARATHLVYTSIRRLIGIPLFYVLTRKYVLVSLFWLPIFMRIKKIKPLDVG